MADWVLRMPWAGEQATEKEPLYTREWLVTNGLGGYASGTVVGLASRRYHGLLIAALPAPLGRQVMLNHLSELVRLPGGKTALLGGEERAGSLAMPGAAFLTEFRLDQGLPVWRYKVQDAVVEKRILLPHLQNTVQVRYRLLEGSGTVRLKLRPSVHFRPHEAPVNAGFSGPYAVKAIERRYEVLADPSRPPLRMFLHGERSAFTVEGCPLPDVRYRVEEARGYEAQGAMWSPGYFRADLAVNQDATLVASTEPWETLLALKPPEAFEAECERRARLLSAAPEAVRTGPGGELVLAADQFLMSPAGRIEDAARAHAAGDEVRSVIAGYHWFTDWGRDTMISLEGLTLTTGRQVEAGYILRTYAHYVRDGLLPNLFPEGEREGLYHTADATLWYFHAIDRYLRATGDRMTLRILLPTLRDIVAHHLKGTRFGIGVDSADGLLKQGAPGYQLTWMDAKVGDWVVTPRRGKAVEINALWYNALKLLERWTREEQSDGDASLLADQAEKARRSFNQRFWYENGGHLYDVVDCEDGGGDDPACRPNQLFAIIALAVGVGCGHEEAAHAGGVAFARPRPSRLQAALRRRHPRPRRRLPPRHCLGLADRTLRRCLAKTAPRRPRRCAPLPERLRETFGRSLHRLDQRSVRRPGAVHPARLRGPSLERVGSAALLAGYRVIPLLFHLSNRLSRTGFRRA